MATTVAEDLNINRTLGSVPAPYLSYAATRDAILIAFNNFIAAQSHVLHGTNNKTRNRIEKEIANAIINESTNRNLNAEITEAFINDSIEAGGTHYPLNLLYLCSTSLFAWTMYLGDELSKHAVSINKVGKVTFDNTVMNIDFEPLKHFKNPGTIFMVKHGEMAETVFNLIKAALSGYSGLVLPSDEYSSYELFFAVEGFASVQAGLDIIKHNALNYYFPQTQDELSDLIFTSFMKVSDAMLQGLPFQVNNGNNIVDSDEYIIDTLAMFEEKVSNMNEYFSLDLNIHSANTIHSFVNLEFITLRKQILHTINQKIFNTNMNPNLSNLVLGMKDDMNSEALLAKGTLALLALDFPLSSIAKELNVARTKLYNDLRHYYGTTNKDELIANYGQTALTQYILYQLKHNHESDLTLADIDLMKLKSEK